MKICHKWMIICLLGAIAVVVVLPKFGLSLAGASLLVPLLMMGCCVLPMVMMLFSTRLAVKGGCCSQKKNHQSSYPEDTIVKLQIEKPSCH